MLGWQVVNAFGVHYEYIGNEDNVLRYIDCYHDKSESSCWIRCANGSDPAKTKELVQKVQRFFEEAINEIQSTESREEQIRLGDFTNSNSLEMYKTYPSTDIKKPEIEISEKSTRTSWINGKYTQLKVKTCAKRYIAVFIDILDVIFDLGETTDKLYASYNIKPAFTGLSVLKSLVDSDRFEDALKKAKEFANYSFHANIQFDLAQYLEEKDRYDLAYEVYSSINTDHLFIEKAKEKMFFIIQNTKNAMQGNIVSKTDMEMKDMLIVELDTMMHFPPEQQSLIDHRIHELCGVKDLTPILTNVRYDGETLLAFCNHIKSLNEKITKLEDMIQK